MKWIPLAFLFFLACSSSAAAQCRVEGVVMSIDGGPVADVIVRMQGPDLRTPATTTTTADGRYAFDNVTPGIRVEVVASLKSGRAIARGFTLVTLPVEKLELHVLPDNENALNSDDVTADGAPAGEIRGIVRSTGGAAVSGARVTINGGVLEATTDAAGRYAFVGLRGGLALDVGASADTFSSARAQVVVPANGRADEDFTLDAGEQVDVTKRDAVVPPVIGGTGDVSYLFVRAIDETASPVERDGVTVFPVRHPLEDVSVLQPTPAARPTGWLDLSVLGGAASIATPIGNKVAVFAAGRQSPPTKADEYLRDQLGASSSYRDANGKIEAVPTPKDRVSVVGYDGTDTVDRSRSVAFPALSTDLAVPTSLPVVSGITTELADGQSWTGRRIGGTWNHQWSSSVSTTVSFGRSESSTDSHLAPLSESNHVDDTNVRLVGSIVRGFSHAVTVGADISSLDVGYNAQSGLLHLFDQQAGARLTTVFAQDAWRPIGRLTILPGVRITSSNLAATTTFDPRIGAEYVVIPYLRVNGSWEIDHQSVNQLTREDLARGDTTFWGLSDGLVVPIVRSQRASIGATLEIPDFVMTLRGYRTAIDDLTMLAPRPFTQTIPDPGRSPLAYGSGIDQGIEWFAQLKSQWNAASAKLTVSEVTYTFPSLEIAAFPASFDQTERFRITDTAHPGNWGFSATWEIDSGRPYTTIDSVVPVWLPSGTLYTFAYEPKNSSRLPMYHRLDLSAQRSFHIRALTTTAGATVFNVYDRQNIGFQVAELAGASSTTSNTLLTRRLVNVYLRFAF